MTNPQFSDKVFGVDGPFWYFETGWWSPWCVIDEWGTRLGLLSRYDVDRDEDIPGRLPKRWCDWVKSKHDAAKNGIHGANTLNGSKMTTNLEGFVIEKINRLEKDWDAQDEGIERSFDRGRTTGEYYGQTGTEHLTCVSTAVGGTAVNTVYLGSSMWTVTIYAILGDSERGSVLRLTYGNDEGAAILPPSLIPEGEPLTGFTPFDADGNLIPDGFEDLGYISENGITIRANLPEEN